MARNTSGFFYERCVSRNIDSYHNRTSIVRALERTLPRLGGSLLDIGCGRKPYRELLTGPGSRVDSYVGLDIPSDRYPQPDVTWDGGAMPFSDGSFDCAIATEVLEHCPDPGALLAESARVLRSRGLLFLTVPFLWPLHDVPLDHFRYTPFALHRMLTDAGFEGIEVRAHGGWDAALAQMIGLWIRRRPMPSWKKSLLSRLAVPVLRSLARRDIVPKEFYESNMITGLSATGFCR